MLLLIQPPELRRTQSIECGGLLIIGKIAQEGGFGLFRIIEKRGECRMINLP
jgi:hypothetical protein